MASDGRGEVDGRGEAVMSREPVVTAEVFKALSDPIRWNIIQQVSREDLLACSILEDTLPVSKPTISYHTKILIQAGVLAVHKRGRNYFYSLRREVLRDVLEEALDMTAAPRTASDDAPRESAGVPAQRPAAPGAAPDTAIALLTW
jgi:DNA-binding transcriptional ArsR family regulator